jgi:hypothetical protein
MSVLIAAEIVRLYVSVSVMNAQSCGKWYVAPHKIFQGYQCHEFEILIFIIIAAECSYRLNHGTFVLTHYHVRACVAIYQGLTLPYASFAESAISVYTGSGGLDVVCRVATSPL